MMTLYKKFRDATGPMQTSDGSLCVVTNIRNIEMDGPGAIPINGNSGHQQNQNDRSKGLHRHRSNTSTLSFVDRVQMAHEEIFAGPMGESVPTSLSSFVHQRQRVGSVTSFAFFRGNQNEDSEAVDESAIVDEESAFRYRDEGYLIDMEGVEFSSSKRSSLVSARDPLLRKDSTKTDRSRVFPGRKISQKIYITTEDLTVVFAGFCTSHLRYVMYMVFCCITLGLGYLLLRWLPRWRVRLIGKPTPLADCHWVAIENQWGEFVTQNVSIKKYGHPLSSVFGNFEKQPVSSYEEEDQILNYLRIIDYRYVRFIYHPSKDIFSLSNSWKDPRWTDVKSIRAGIDSEEKEVRELVFGKNLIEIKQKTIPQLLVDEVFHPFYVFQAGSLLLWSLDEYYYYAACIFLISLVSIVTTLRETRSTMRRLHEISRFECDVRVLRNSFWLYVTSSELVPGDIYEVTDPALKLFPCDSILLAGDCIVNESMLTGESVPVSKIPISDEALRAIDLSAASIAPEIAKHFLFGGTKVIRARRPQDDGDGEAVGLAMTVRSGFNTTKGALVRSMLFPKPSAFKFYRDSFRYISVMGIIAILGFIASFVNFMRMKLAWHLIIVRALDLITIVVPPALPATLTIGTNFALSRLRKKQIFCISPQRVNVGGKLDLICFDKTGTLTEDSLDVLGVRIVLRPEHRFTDLFTTASSLCPTSVYEQDPTIEYGIHKAALFTMATCHSLHIVDGKFVGDPLDVKMFEFTGWSFEEGEQKGNADEEEQRGLSPSIARPPPEIVCHLSAEAGHHNGETPIELGVVKSFDFIPQLRRASVVVRTLGSQGCDIYVKGAPECMKNICIPSSSNLKSVPLEYEELLSYYTHRGYRVIACATKNVPKLNWVKAQKLQRDEAESDLEFVGFIIFENKLKPATTKVLDELTEAGIRKVMCTGDNILTAISVARKCKLIDPTRFCFVPQFIEGTFKDQNARLTWESIDNKNITLDPINLMPFPLSNEGDASLHDEISNLQNYSLAIGGDVFRWLVDFAPPDLLQRILIHAQIFARMSPDEKHELVEKFQSIEYCCGFCGDGANDCGALKAADVGISLSEAEASVAAPFTSRVFDITCVPEVIREGRAALVTSFSCFKYMSLYSAIQFTSVSLLYASASNLGDFQFLYIDLLLILPIAILMGRTGAFPILCRKQPTANLVSQRVLIPLLGQIFISIIYQIVGIYVVRKQSWYIPPHLHRKHSSIKNSDNTVLFLLSCFEYILSGIVLSVGPPFRKSMTQNLPFVVTIVVTLLFSIYMLLDPSRGIASFMQLTLLSWKFKVFILIFGLSYGLTSWVSEMYLFPRLADYFGKVIKSGKQRGRKRYQIIQSNLYDY